MTELEQKELMVSLGRSFYERGYTVGGAGNLSALMKNASWLRRPVLP